MSSLVEKLLSRARATTAEAIRGEQSKAERALQDAQDALAASKAAYADALLDERPEVTARARGLVGDREIAVERAEALVCALRERFLQACESESQAAREQDYEAAKRALLEAEQKVSADYAKAVTGLLKLIEGAAEALRAVERANANLPDGQLPIALPPSFGGQTPSLPELILDRQVVDRWTFEATGQLVGDEHEVITNDNVRGIIETAGRNQPVIRRSFDLVKYHPAESHSWSESFFRTLRLPRLDNPASALWAGGADAPEDLLAEVRQALSTLRTKPVSRKRPVQTRLVPI